ncbi:MAG TPA: hypothetical protein ENI59_00165 [Euryarchaeota archaeon]|nr:hypothetical protein [Euryarchaeota archaeon]
MLSAFLGFIVGLFVFQVRGIKKIWEALEVLGTILFIYGFLSLIFLHMDFTSAFNEILSFIFENVLSTSTYLIGANISRGRQFGVISDKIFIYIAVALTLLFFWP